MLTRIYRQYSRSCYRFLRKVAIECLKRFGIYIFFLQVPEADVDLRVEL